MFYLCRFPDSEVVMMNMINFDLVPAGDYQAIISLLVKFTQNNPEKPTDRLIIEVANMLSSTGRPEEERQVLLAGLQKFPDHRV